MRRTIVMRDPEPPGEDALRLIEQERRREWFRDHWTQGVAFNQHCGIEVRRWDDEAVELFLPYAEMLSAHPGIFHGGVVSALLDTSASGAVMAGHDFAKGSRLELELRPNRFLVRPLELPARATEFIEGIVRVQIYRLTPWTAAEAVFGCTPPIMAGNGKIVTTIAASTRAATEPYIAGLAALHPASMSVFTRAGEQSRDLIKVFEQQARG